MNEPQHNHHKGAAGCPVCARHDHTDSTVFALEANHQPIPAWWFTCPKCGTRDAQTYAHEWTPAGIQWMRTNTENATNGAA